MVTESAEDPVAHRDDTHVSLSCCCDQVPNKDDLRKGSAFGSQFEGTQSVVTEKMVDTGG